MHLFSYVAVGVTYYFISIYEKRIRIGGISAAIPLFLLSGVGLLAVTFALFGGVIITIACILSVIVFLIKKIKLVVGAKAIALWGAIISSLYGIVWGPTGWVCSAIVLILLIWVVSSYKEIAYTTYNNIFLFLAKIFLFIRDKSDKVRALLPASIKFLVLLLELPAVCYLSAKGMWEILDWFDGDEYVTTEMVVFRTFVIIPFSLMLYRSYIKDTSPPNTGGDGWDLPGPDLTGVITGSIHP